MICYIQINHSRFFLPLSSESVWKSVWWESNSESIWWESNSEASGEKATVEASGNYKLAVIGKMKLECAYLQVMWATMSRQLEPQGGETLYLNPEENLWP